MLFMNLPCSLYTEILLELPNAFSYLYILCQL